MFCGLKALESYLQFDKLTEVKVNKLYTYLLEEDSNIANPQTEVDRLGMEDFLHITQLPQKGEVLTLLNNLIIKQIKVISEIKNTVHLPVERYFTYSEIQQLIVDNRMLI